MQGIYCYRDLNNHGKIVYIGKDSNIGINKRHYAHIAPCNYNEQQINRVLQNNPNRYEYEVILKGDISEKLLNAYEKVFIRRYDPKFCFTNGGEGISGFKHSEETKRKISESLIGKEKPNLQGRNHPMYGKHHSEETKRKLSEANKGKKGYWAGKKRSKEDKMKMSEAQKGNQNMKGKKHSEESKKKMSEAHIKKYARIIKHGKNYGKPRYSIMMNGKVIKSSVYPFKLLEWFAKEYPKKILQIKINMEE